jgi:hypothetical protein
MDIRVGRVTHYLNRLSIAVLELTGKSRVGETLHILGISLTLDSLLAQVQTDAIATLARRKRLSVSVRVLNRVMGCGSYPLAQLVLQFVNQVALDLTR